jgi:cytochrome bd-type quinol oxidase subunit 2
MAVLVGGAIFARLVMTRTIGAAAPEARDALAERAAVVCRPLVIAAIAGLLVSGTYRFFFTTGHSLRHNIALGLKMALALHVFAAALLIVRSGNPRRRRMLTGMAISGLAIVLISAWLGRIY